MSSCSYRDSCHFYQRYEAPQAGDKLTRQLFVHYCEQDRSHVCAIRQHFERTGTRPPRNLLPDGGVFVSHSEINRLALFALGLALLALLLTLYHAFR
jgi:hypothetical protein